MIELPILFGLTPDDERRLHPHALAKFNRWRTDILTEVPQLRTFKVDEITADLDTYLDDNQRARLRQCFARIVDWLSKCMDLGEGHYSYAYAKWVTDPMIDVKWLIKKAYGLKVEKVEMEQRKREREQRWQVAYKAVNPPLGDAKTYLSGDEHGEFIEACRQAILARTEKGEDYLGDMRSLDYCRYLDLINTRKEKERQLMLAKAAAGEFDRCLKEEEGKLQALLCPDRKDLESYFRKQVKDRRYAGQSFSRLMLREEEQDFDKTVVETSRKKTDELVSADLRPFFTTECWRSFFLLPSAYYMLEEVPCLNFTFDVFAVIETGVWLKPRQKKFGGYVFDLPLREEQGDSSIKTPEFLGYHHVVLTAEDLGQSFWQSIPLVILKGLLVGESRPSGATVISASEDKVTYEVEGFEEEVEIPAKFAEYLKGIGSIDGMVKAGIITETVADIVTAELAKIETGQSTVSLSGTPKDKDTLKAKAFHQFSQGKKPSDSEVKDLGIKPKTAYRYHQEWKKVCSHSQS
jgi:hypothetical protein